MAGVSTGTIISYTVALVVVTIIGDLFLKKAAVAQFPLLHSYNWLGALMYALSAFGWGYLMRFTTLDVIAVIYSVVTLVVLSVIGWTLFNEPVTAKKLAGITFAILAIVLVGD